MLSRDTNFDSLTKGFSWDIPSRLNMATQVCDDWAARQPARTAIIDMTGPRRRDVSYAALREMAETMATALLDTACGFAAYTRVGDVLASNVSVCFMAGGAAERFRARGHVVKAGRRQVFTAAELFAVPDEGSHRLIATATTILVPAA